MARKIAAVRSFFAFGVNSLGLPNNPAARLRTPKKDSRLPTVLKPQQAAALVSAADRDDAPPEASAADGSAYARIGFSAIRT